MIHPASAPATALLHREVVITDEEERQIKAGCREVALTLAKTLIKEFDPEKSRYILTWVAEGLLELAEEVEDEDSELFK